MVSYYGILVGCFARCIFVMPLPLLPQYKYIGTRLGKHELTEDFMQSNSSQYSFAHGGSNLMIHSAQICQRWLMLCSHPGSFTAEEPTQQHLESVFICIGLRHQQVRIATSVLTGGRSKG